MHKQQTKNATQPQRSSRSVSHRNFSLIRKLSLSAKIPSSKMSFEHQKKTQSSEENMNKCILFPRSINRQTGMQVRLLSRRLLVWKHKIPKTSKHKFWQWRDWTSYRDIAEVRTKPHTPFSPQDHQHVIYPEFKYTFSTIVSLKTQFYLQRILNQKSQISSKKTSSISVSPEIDSTSIKPWQFGDRTLHNYC